MVVVCPNIQATGMCMDAACTLKHDVYMCLPCGVVARSEGAKKTHLNSNRYLKHVQSYFQTLRYPAGVFAGVDTEEANSQARAHIFCSTCERYVREDAWAYHPQGQLHQLKQGLDTMRVALQEAAKDKHGVTVSQVDGVNFGVLYLSDNATSCYAETTLEISLTVPSSWIFLAEAKLSPDRPLQRASP
jgi:helicase MOV-10